MTDLERVYQLLTTGTGIQRSIHADLEREAAERASEARQQVGTSGTMKITHPTQAEREARLGSEWAGMGVTELAAWNYEYLDPIQALIDYTRSDGGKVGLLNSEPHRTILFDPRFEHWGAGLYTELPDGLEPWQTRYYLILWMSVDAAVTNPEPTQTFSDVAPDDLFYGDIEGMAALGIARGYPDGTFRPDDPVSRGQLMAFLARARKAPPG